MTTTCNGQQQLDLMRAIALRALMNASGDNCYCPVKKPTKFIVTLKPIVKLPDTDPFINLQRKSSSCTCNTTKPQKNPTAEQIQVRNNNEALKGKTLLNAFRVLNNSKFITIDPQYEFTENMQLSPSRQKIRLTGGALKARQTNEKEIKVPRGQSRFLQPGQERGKLAKPAKNECSKDSRDAVTCENERIYRILQHNCFQKNPQKLPLKCRIVCHGEHVTVEKRKEKKSEKEEKKKPREPAKDRKLLRKELEMEPEETQVPPPQLIPPAQISAPKCTEKPVGTSDEAVAATQPHKTVDVFGWDPLKYFGISCSGARKADAEPCAAKPPCPLAAFPFPEIKNAEAMEEPPLAPAQLEQPCHPVIEECLPCHEKEVYEPHSPQHVQPCDPMEEERLPQHEREDYKPRKAPPQPGQPDISNDIIAHQCNRFHNLELQVNELRHELGRMRKEVIPPDDMLRCTALTSKLRELTALLADLKNRHAEAIATVIMAQKHGNESTKCVTTAEPTIATHVQPTPVPRPLMKAETIQTCFPCNHTDKISQTNASFGWRPSIDEATQSSPPSTVPVTPKHTSSAPTSSLPSSAASSSLPCRHGTGEIPLEESPSFCPYCQQSEYPCCTYVEQNLYGEIMALLKYHASCDVLLSVLLQPNNLYHISISVTSTGEPLGCIYATEHAINEAAEEEVFSRFLTFFIVDARISVQQKDKILAHTFEFFKN